MRSRYMLAIVAASTPRSGPGGWTGFGVGGGGVANGGGVAVSIDRGVDGAGRRSASDPEPGGLGVGSGVAGAGSLGGPLVRIALAGGA